MLSQIAASPARAERGQDLAEYALVLGLVAIAVIAVVTLLGDSFSALLGAIASEVGP